MNEQARTLLVLWQHRESRQFIPAGRLTAYDGGQQPFEFVYVRGYERAAKLGFAPFVAFPDIGRAYRSLVLFPFFRNRILQRSRPDYAKHTCALGLVDPFDALD